MLQYFKRITKILVGIKMQEISNNSDKNYFTGSENDNIIR